MISNNTEPTESLESELRPSRAGIGHPITGVVQYVLGEAQDPDVSVCSWHRPPYVIHVVLMSTGSCTWSSFQVAKGPWKQASDTNVCHGGLQERSKKTSRADLSDRDRTAGG